MGLSFFSFSLFFLPDTMEYKFGSIEFMLYG